MLRKNWLKDSQRLQTAGASLLSKFVPLLHLGGKLHQSFLCLAKKKEGKTKKTAFVRDALHQAIRQSVLMFGFQVSYAYMGFTEAGPARDLTRDMTQ